LDQDGVIESTDDDQEKAQPDPCKIVVQKSPRFREMIQCEMASIANSVTMD